MHAIWTAPDGNTEFAISFDQQRKNRVLVIPALFDEANKLRRLTIEVMRRLDASGVDCFLPDLPGCHDSLTNLSAQSLSDWRNAVALCVEQFGATHVFSLRAGALIVPTGMPGWRYSPVTGSRVLRGLLRARVIAARENGIQEKPEDLLSVGRKSGLVLAGYALSAEMVGELADSQANVTSDQIELLQSDIGGAGLWLKAEPDFDAAQADALAAAIAAGIAG